jgi:hypothetical protein
LLNFLEIFLGELKNLNKKFKLDKGNISEAKNNCEGIFIKFSNIILKQQKHSLTLNERLKLIDYDKKSKLAHFDYLGFYKKSEFELLNYLIGKYSETTKLNDLDKGEQTIIVKNLEKFLRSALYRMKKYYTFNDELQNNLSSLHPDFFKREHWIYLKKRFHIVIFTTLKNLFHSYILNMYIGFFAHIKS